MTNLEKMNINDIVKLIHRGATPHKCAYCVRFHKETGLCAGRGINKCQIGITEYLNSPAEPAKPKLTEGEKTAVQWAVKFGIKWLARNADNLLFLYITKPIKSGGAWFERDGFCEHIDSVKYPFSFIKWSDSEPTYLPDLLGDCE